MRLNLRLTSLRGGDDVWRAELLQERRFGENGGVAGAGFTLGLAPDWFVTVPTSRWATAARTGRASGWTCS